MSKRNVRIEFALGIGETNQQQLREYITKHLNNVDVHSVSEYNAEFSFSGSHAGAFDLQAFINELKEVVNDNVILAEDELK